MAFIGAWRHLAPALDVVAREIGVAGKLVSMSSRSWKSSPFSKMCRCRFYVSSAAAAKFSFPQEVGVLGVRSYEEARELALRDNDQFWRTIAEQRLLWHKPFQTVNNCDMKSGKVSWFEEGLLNVSVNCVDRHLGKGKVAIIWERDEPGSQVQVTFEQLYVRMNRLANCLKSFGIKKGDRVAIYMQASPDMVAAMMACARIGAIHSVVFAGFSPEALAARINGAEARLVITTDEGVRGGRRIPLKSVVDAAVAKCACVKTVLVASRTGSAVLQHPRDVDLEEALAHCDDSCEPEPMESNDLLFLLYTSGSTGKPKGIGHATAGYLLYASLTHQMVFGYEEGDIHGCLADIGWITGHSYVVYGPLANGATSVLFESVPHYPDPGRYWETVERLKINQFYTAPTAIRMLLKSGDDYVKRYDRSSLKRLGSVGEPLNHEAYEWYRDVVGEGRCDVVDTWWQTETGGIMITPRPSAPGDVIEGAMPMRPFFGVDLAVVNGEEEVPAEKEAEGALYIKRPWPGMAKTIWGDQKRFVETYFGPRPGLFFSGDGARRDSRGFYQITGRLDDVINVAGHRLGTAEVEDALDGHEGVAEAAVVGYPHAIKGEGIYAYVILKDEFTHTEDIVSELRLLVRKSIAPYAVPDAILVCAALPKTRSGKIMRRILRKIACHEFDALGDTSTLADPTVVAAIIESHKKLVKKH